MKRWLTRLLLNFLSRLLPKGEELDRILAVRARMLLSDLYRLGAVDERVPDSVGKHCRYCLQWKREGPIHDAECLWLPVRQFNIDAYRP